MARRNRRLTPHPASPFNGFVSVSRTSSSLRYSRVFTIVWLRFTQSRKRSAALPCRRTSSRIELAFGKADVVGLQQRSTPEMVRVSRFSPLSSPAQAVRQRSEDQRKQGHNLKPAVIARFHFDACPHQTAPLHTSPWRFTVGDGPVPPQPCGLRVLVVRPRRRSQPSPTCFSVATVGTKVPCTAATSGGEERVVVSFWCNASSSERPSRFVRADSGPVGHADRGT